MSRTNNKTHKYSKKSLRLLRSRSHAPLRRHIPTRPYSHRRTGSYPENLVYVEEPATDDNSDDTEEIVYGNEPSHQNYSTDDSDADNEEEDDEENVIFYYTDDKNIPHVIDMDDEMAQQALQDELYSDSDSSDLSDEGMVIDLNDELQASAVRQMAAEEGFFARSTSDDLSDSDDPQTYNERVLEAVRREFADELCEDNLSSEEENNLGSEPEFFDAQSDANMEYDAGDPRNYDFVDSSSSSSDDDEEGVTIYKHRFDLPDNLEDESCDEELMDQVSESEYDRYQDMVATASESESDEEEDNKYDSEGLLCAQDSENEEEEDGVTIVDISEDMENLKDCELVEIEDGLFKLILRLPSLIQDQTNIDFDRETNELIVRGKLAFHDHEEADADESSDETLSFGEESSDNDSSDSSDSDSSDSSDSDSDSSNSDSSDIDSDSSDSDSDEEVVEDTRSHIKEFSNHEIGFEKHIQFVKRVMFDQIDASYNRHGELEVLIPCYDDDADESRSLYPIAIQSA